MWGISRASQMDCAQSNQFFKKLCSGTCNPDLGWLVCARCKNVSITERPSLGQAALELRSYASSQFFMNRPRVPTSKIKHGKWIFRSQKRTATGLQPSSSLSSTHYSKYSNGRNIVKWGDRLLFFPDLSTVTKTLPFLFKKMRKKQDCFYIHVPMQKEFIRFFGKFSW
jgi:hypothetical protein